MKYVLLFLFVLSHFELLSQIDSSNTNLFVTISEPETIGNHHYLNGPVKFVGKSNLLVVDQHDFIHLLDFGDDRKMKIRPDFVDSDERVQAMEITHDGLKAVIAFQKVTFKKIRKNAPFSGGLDSAFDFETRIVCLSLENLSIQWEVGLAEISMCDGVFILPGDSLACILSRLGHNVFVDLSSGKVLRNIRHRIPVGNGRNMVISRSGRYLAYWNKPSFKSVNLHAGSKLRVLDLVKDEIVYTKFIGGRGVWSGVFTTDEAAILAGSYDGSLKLWKFNSNSLKLVQQARKPIADLTLVEADRQLLGINRFISDTVVFYKYPEMQKVCQIRLFGDNYFVGSSMAVMRYAIRDDGRIFALLRRDNKICLYRTDSWLLVKEIEVD